MKTVRNLGKIFIFLFTILNSLFGATLEATVDKKEVTLGDSIHMSIKATSQNIPSIPDIQEINGIPISHKSQSSDMQFSSINGQIETQNSATLEFDFVPINTMTIKPISLKIDGQLLSTKPINIVVNGVNGVHTQTQNSSLSQSNTQIPSINGDYGLVIKPSKTQIYKGESINVKVIFIENKRTNILKMNYIEPSFKDFTTQQIGKEKGYEQNGRIIHEMEYLLTPKSSGVLKIEPAKVQVILREIDSLGFASTVQKEIESQSVDIKVINPTTQTDLIGSFTISDSIDKNEVDKSNSVKLKINIRGVGDMSRWSGIDFVMDGVSVFPKEANISSNTLNGEVHSDYTQEFEFIAQKDFVIPSKSISVYDYKTGKIYTLKTKEYPIKVKNSDVSNLTSLISGNQSRDVLIYSEDNFTFFYALLKKLLYILAFIVLIFGVVKFFKKFKKSPFKILKQKFIIDEEMAFKKLYPHISSSLEIEQMVQQLYDKKHGKEIIIDKEKLKKLLDNL